MTETPEAPKGYKIVEHVIDGGLTVKRYLVPSDTTEDDITEGSTLLDENETKGILARSAKAEIILVGDPVRSRKEPELQGNVTGKLKTGKLQVRWDNGKVDRLDSGDLAKIY
jgi:hypothetical protein